MRYASTVLAGSARAPGLLSRFNGLCENTSVDPPAAVPISVAVSYPVEQEVTDYAEFTARTAAVDCVEVRARVWGYLAKVNFEEGSLVKKGDVLFELDRRPYQAEILPLPGQSEALAKSHLTRTSADLQACGRNCWRRRPFPQSDYDVARDDRDQAAAAVEAGAGGCGHRGTQLEFHQDYPPISGRVSRYLVTVGNMVESADQANVTLLTTIVSVDPIYAYFDVDEGRTVHARSAVAPQRQGQVVSR